MQTLLSVCASSKERRQNSQFKINDKLLWSATEQWNTSGHSCNSFKTFKNIFLSTLHMLWNCRYIFFSFSTLPWNCWSNYSKFYGGLSIAQFVLGHVAVFIPGSCQIAVSRAFKKLIFPRNSYHGCAQTYTWTLKTCTRVFIIILSVLVYWKYCFICQNNVHSMECQTLILYVCTISKKALQDNSVWKKRVHVQFIVLYVVLVFKEVWIEQH